MGRFPDQFDYDLRNLASTPVQRSTHLRDNSFFLKGKKNGTNRRDKQL